jgi:DNA-binding GntR family transcriptional regulator
MPATPLPPLVPRPPIGSSDKPARLFPVATPEDEPIDLSMRVGRVAAPLREQVLELLRGAILDFRLKPGQRLIERELIDQIGVSRTTIREVLRELAAEGLVATIPQKGAVVVVPSAEEAAEIYEVRGALESLAARRFVGRASDEQVRELRAAFEEFARVGERSPDDTRTILGAKDRLYEVLLDGAGSSAIRSMLGSLQARVRLLRATSLTQPGRAARSVEEMRAVIEAIEARDADAAAAACAEHVSQAASAGLAESERASAAPAA